METVVEELAKAQQASEQRLGRVETAVEELAKAQKRTEQELGTLISEHKETRRQLGGLSMTVGYGLENQAYKALPALLKRDFDLVVQKRLIRTYGTKI